MRSAAGAVDAHGALCGALYALHSGDRERFTQLQAAARASLVGRLAGLAGEGVARTNTLLVQLQMVDCVRCDPENPTLET